MGISGLAFADNLPKHSPVNQDFSRYLAAKRFLAPAAGLTSTDSSAANLRDLAIDGEGHHTGHVPSPVDISHMTGKMPKFLLGEGASSAAKAGALHAPLVGPAGYAAPATFDLRSLGLVTPVRDQGACGDCWAFATMGSMESNLLVSGSGSYDLSENHLNVRAGFDFLPCGGGNAQMGTAYLSRWGNSAGYAAGPVYETDDPYTSVLATSVSGLSPRLHAQEAAFLPNRANATDNANWQYALQQYGGVYVGMYIDTTTPGYWNAGTASYYYNGSLTQNHAVTLVGWDDNYPASNFASPPPGNGAFIAKNQWGSTWGNGGYFYISYYDAQLNGAVAIEPAEPTTNYTHEAMYDPHGWTGSWGYGSSVGWGGNVFTAGSNEPPLKAVSFYTTGVDTAYTVYVYTNVTGTPSSGALQSAATASGTIPYAGYHTVTLPAAVPLTGGQNYSVVVKYNTPGTAYPVPTESAVSGYNSTVATSPGKSYLSSNGSSWTDMSGYTAIINIRALTGLDLTPLPGGNKNAAYSQIVSANGGIAPYAVYLVKGSLPPGLTLASDGTLSGTPTATGTYNFTLDATDSTAPANGGPFAGSSSYSLAIAGAAQTISFGAPPTVPIGGNGTASATASSGLAVSFSSLTPSNCTVAGSTVTGVYAGTCTIAANQAGNADYAPAPQVTQSITLGTSQTISFGAAPSVNVGGTGTVSATASSGLAVSFSSLTPSACSVSGGTVTGLASGTCTVAADQAGNANYLAAPQATQSFTVNKNSQTISFGAAPTVNVGGTGTVSATASSGLAVSFSSLTPSACSVSGGTVTGLAGGTCTIAADQAGNANYLAAPQATQSFTVNKNSQTIAFGAAPSVVVGGTGTVSATASSGLAVTFSSLTPTVCTNVGATVTGVAAGTCTMAADQAGNASYNPAPQATQNFTVKAPAINLGTGTYNFGAVTKATTASFTLSNTGNAPLVIKTIAMASNTKFKLASGGTCAVNGTVAAGGSCTQKVTFTPSGTTVYSDTLTITGTATGTTTPVYSASRAMTGS
jgi:C1A family cysteine protease